MEASGGVRQAAHNGDVDAVDALVAMGVDPTGARPPVVLSGLGPRGPSERGDGEGGGLGHATSKRVPSERSSCIKGATETWDFPSQFIKSSKRLIGPPLIGTRPLRIKTEGPSRERPLIGSGLRQRDRTQTTPASAQDRGTSFGPSACSLQTDCKQRDLNRIKIEGPRGTSCQGIKAPVLWILNFAFMPREALRLCVSRDKERPGVYTRGGGGAREGVGLNEPRWHGLRPLVTSPKP